MKLRSAYFLVAMAAGLFSSSIFSAPRANPQNYLDITAKIAEEVLKRGTAFSNLKSFVADGPRLCGSSGAAHAVEWAQTKLGTYGLDRVWLQPVRVPVWSRGDHEIATVLTTSTTPINLRVTALGNSAGTLPQGLEAQVIEVHSLKEAERLGAQIRGKIVFFNRPMDPTLMTTRHAAPPRI
jgi:carboxypeptidase Q